METGGPFAAVPSGLTESTGVPEHNRSETPPSIKRVSGQYPPRAKGKVTGIVKLRDLPPPAGVVDLQRWPLCAQKHPQGLRFEDLVVSPDGGVRWAIVYVAKGLEDVDLELPRDPVTLSLSDYRYTPHVMALRAFQQLKIKNDDTEVHLVVQVGPDGTTRAHQWALEAKQAAGIRFSGGNSLYVIGFRCDVHPWEAAWVGVSGHPYWVITDEGGRYGIPDLPVGRYTLAVWHERFNPVLQDIEVTDQADTEANFTLAKERR